MVRRWQTRKSFLLPVCRAVIYPFAWTFAIVALPFTAGALIKKECMGDKKKEKANREERMQLKPPIQTDV
jgi:hypothetical protein